MAEPTKTFRDHVADTLLDQIRTNTAPWQQPCDSGTIREAPYNPVSGKPYQGINSLWLQSQGRDDPRWLTYQQAETLGAQVRKGEKATQVEYWQWHEWRPLFDDAGNPLTGDDGKQAYKEVRLERPNTFRINIFNAEQIDGLERYIAPEPGVDADADQNRCVRHPDGRAVLYPCQQRQLHGNRGREPQSEGQSRWR